MRISRGHREALAAYDITQAALAELWQEIKARPQGSKLPRADLQLLCDLSRAVEQWQERIRIHRRTPLPGRGPSKPAKAKAKAPAGRAAGGRPARVADLAPPVPLDESPADVPQTTTRSEETIDPDPPED